MQMKKHLFGENNSLNEFQYLTELVIGFQPRHNLVKKKRSLLLDDSWSFIASSLNPILFAWELDLFSPYMSDSIRNQASINEMKWNKKKNSFWRWFHKEDNYRCCKCVILKNTCQGNTSLILYFCRNRWTTCWNW